MPRNWRRMGSLAVLLPAAVFVAHKAFADLDGSYVLPTDHPAIAYATAPLHDPIAKLQERLKAGQEKLAWDPAHGYLPAMLRALHVPLSSQVLVFSKTSFQAPRISPRTPRSLYFNDQASVGWVMGGDVVELAALDPERGVVFYTLDQEQTDKPAIERRNDCLQCHASGGTLGVPGLVVRSIYPEPSGMPLFHAGGYVTDDRSPFKERWGGWYVTGTHGKQRHMGNIFAVNKDNPRDMDPEKGANVTDLKGRFDTGAYLTPDSDIVALMVLEHQTRMTNLIIRVGFETRMAVFNQRALNKELGQPLDEISDSTRRRIENASAELVKYLLFEDEAPLVDDVKGTSTFAADFAGRGLRDAQGRSLRDFDLHTRLMKHRCSYMIYSEAFDALPPPARDFIYRRLLRILNGEEKSSLGAPERQAILEILRATKPNLPAYFRPLPASPLPGVRTAR